MAKVTAFLFSMLYVVEKVSLVVGEAIQHFIPSGKTEGTSYQACVASGKLCCSRSKAEFSRKDYAWKARLSSKCTGAGCVWEQGGSQGYRNMLITKVFAKWLQSVFQIA